MRNIEKKYNRGDSTNPSPGTNNENFYAEECNSIKDELMGFVTASGQTLSEPDAAQLLKSVNEAINTRSLYSVSGTSTAAALVLTSISGNQLQTSVQQYRTGMEVGFIATLSHTSGFTVKVDSLTAKAVTRKDGSAFVAGDIVSGEYYTLKYDGTSFRLMNRTVTTQNAVPALTNYRSPEQAFLQSIESTFAELRIPAGQAIIFNDGEIYAVNTDIVLTNFLTVAFNGLAVGSTYAQGKFYVPILCKGTSGVTLVLSDKCNISASSAIVAELPTGYTDKWARLPFIVPTGTQTSNVLYMGSYHKGWTRWVVAPDSYNFTFSFAGQSTFWPKPSQLQMIRWFEMLADTSLPSGGNMQLNSTVEYNATSLQSQVAFGNETIQQRSIMRQYNLANWLGVQLLAAGTGAHAFALALVGVRYATEQGNSFYL